MHELLIFIVIFLLLSDLFMEAIELRLLPKRRSQSSFAQVLPRKAAVSQQVLYVVGGMSRREATKSGERYDPKEGRWKAIGEFFQGFSYRQSV